MSSYKQAVGSVLEELEGKMSAHKQVVCDVIEQLEGKIRDREYTIGAIRKEFDKLKQEVFDLNQDNQRMRERMRANGLQP